ncbi:copper amine oxidase N-terminal domain-containing protein [Paenibacillus xerothermodurans]|uniref:Copper amine oxidase N-terminal domain-containing protein n=1 Tax=Paenibacillus xerothermodurans TaxID=1977292 RepID=A0A2W1NVR6_PAEXE|nr:copper amine oxidase N-terminal domain-containing protein [Paenibacillus xerothermodurans]PZE19782.1 copper amine oxidase N-terminal domain-containing protein [Paenibacillus xerothermodurans]
MKSMKTKCIPLVLGFALLMPAAVGAAELTPVEGSIVPSEIIFTLNGTDMTVNGKVTAMDAQPTQKDGFTYIPLRYAAEAMGAVVTWNAEDRAATMQWDNKSVLLTVGTDKVLINGEEKIASSNVTMIGERAMIPVSLFTELTGWTADLADEGKTIRLLRP